MIRSVRLDDETNELLERAAEEAGVTPSEFIRDSLKRAIRADRGAYSGSLSARIKALIGPVDAKATSGLRGRSRARSKSARDSSLIYADLLVEKHERRQRRARGKTR